MAAFVLVGLLAGWASCPGWDLEITISGRDLWVFNGIPNPEGWGDPLVYRAGTYPLDWRKMGGLGGIPVVDIWGPDGGVAVFNTSTVQEPMEVLIRANGTSATLLARGGGHLVRYDHQGDFYDALREFAQRMDAVGMALQGAPDWAFDPIWETYGFEENWDASDIYGLVPVMQELGIGAITLDSGWYGDGRGYSFEFYTGDFPVNDDIIGTEADLVNLITTLHGQGFGVRLWWPPGVAELQTDLFRAHRDWFLRKVVSSTGDTGDYYLDPTLPEVAAWNRSVVERFVGYGADGFKHDDVFHIISEDPTVREAYADLFRDVYETATAVKPYFVVNTCNCGVAQNFYQFPGQNQVITSDPVGSRQFRIRAKVYQAFNLHGTAILSDHVELTRGDVGPLDLIQPGFYSQVDFASVVPLGLVLETKFRIDPGQHYRDWFRIYRERQFYGMEWVNVPYYGDVETYLLRDGEDLYFSFFARGYESGVTLVSLEPGRLYEVLTLETGEQLTTFLATGEEQALPIPYYEKLTIQVRPAG